MSTPELDKRLAHLAQDLANADGVANTVDEIVRFAQQTLDADEAGITLIHKRGKRFESIGVTSPDVEMLDRLQYDLGEGPCHDAAVESRILRSTDLGNDGRWPRWGPEAARHGFHSAMSIELHAGGQRIGALNLYGGRKRDFTLEDAAVGDLIGYHASSAMLAARTAETMRAALDNRTLIGQAQGILMERFGITPTAAFHVLRRYSQDNNVKLRDVARDMIADGGLPDAERM